MGEKRKLVEISKKRNDEGTVPDDDEVKSRGRVARRYTSTAPRDVGDLMADLTGILSNNYELAKGLNQQDSDARSILKDIHCLSQELRELCSRVEAFNC